MSHAPLASIARAVALATLLSQASGGAALAQRAQPTPAQAQPPVTADSLGRPPGYRTDPPLRRPQPGTHFFLELTGGVALPEPPVPVMGGALLGAGAKLKGSPFRFYALLGVLGSTAQVDEGPADRKRSDLLVAAGLRAYVGLIPGLRLYAEALVGGQRAWDTLTPLQGRNLAINRWRPEFDVGAGLQFRFIRALSLGAGVRYRSFEDPLSEVAAAQGLPELSPWVGHGSITLHF